MDAFKALELLRASFPQAFHTLSTEKTTYHKYGENHHMYYRRTMIDLDENEDIVALNYAPPFEGTLCIPAKAMEDYYTARRSLSKVASIDSSLVLIRLARF